MNIKNWNMPKITKDKVRFSTLNFLFIIAYVNIFQLVFGPENSITGVIFTIMMSASMVRDMTASPVKHLFVQAAVLVWMALAAYWVNTLSAPWSFTVNFITILIILYAFTYEYSSHMYFPYILSYLFLVYISPADAGQLPRRLLSMLTGAVSILLYQWFMGRNRAAETARDVLVQMIDDILLLIACKNRESSEPPSPADVHRSLSRLSQMVYERRRKVLCVSDAAFSMIAAGRGLEHLHLLVSELPDHLSLQNRSLLLHTETVLESFRAFLCQEAGHLPPQEQCSLPSGSGGASEPFSRALLYIRGRMLHMTDPERRTHYRRTVLSLKVRLQAALGLSPVRAVYALRTALLLSFAALLVQFWALPHGRWLMFTLASVSLPYADDVPVKMKKRLTATLAGGLISVVIYSLIPSAAGRTAAMMLSGYISFYFTDYAQTFACSTVGALGGAVFMTAFGLPAVGHIFLIRLGYILAGIAAAFAVNCLLLPYTRKMATRHLWKKYRTVTELLADICRTDEADTQLYYHLVIQAYMMEEKLAQNAELEEWSGFPGLLKECREKVYQAHRTLAAKQHDAPAFEPGHLS